MSRWTFEELMRATEGEALRGAPGGEAWSGVSIDSRTVSSGQVFLCLRGDRTDGHEYIDAALAAGAGALIVERGAPRVGALPEGARFVVAVDDGLVALQNLARFHRARLTNTLILGVTGSNGKTSTKEMLVTMAGHLLGPEKVFATPGNLNNHIGLPLSVLGIDTTTELAVLGMGMNHAGEIALLSNIARPHHALITSVSGAHREFFDTVEDIARAKLEITVGLENEGTVVFHLYSPGGELALDLIRRRRSPRHGHRLKLVFFGGWPDSGGSMKPWPFVSESLDSLLWDNRLSMIEHVQITKDGLRFGWQGTHVECPAYFTFEMAENLLGALTLLEATGRFFPDQLREAAAHARPLTGRRFEVVQGRSDGRVGLLVDDSYNANPAAFIASLRALRELLPSGRLAVFAGEMAELGDSARADHRQVGEFAAAQGYDLFVGCGVDHARSMQEAFAARSTKGRSLVKGSASALVDTLFDVLGDGHYDGVLVKGSRSARMDLVSDALRENF